MVQQPTLLPLHPSVQGPDIGAKVKGPNIAIAINAWTSNDVHQVIFHHGLMSIPDHPGFWRFLKMTFLFFFGGVVVVWVFVVEKCGSHNLYKFLREPNTSMWTHQHYIWVIFQIGLLAVWFFSTFDVKLFHVQITSCLGHSVAITQSSSTTACPAPAKIRIKIRTPSPAPTTRAISAGDKVFPPERVWYSFSIAMKLLRNPYVRCGLVNNYIWPLSTGQYTFGLAYIGISWPSSPGISNWRSAQWLRTPAVWCTNQIYTCPASCSWSTIFQAGKLFKM